jgi:predicted Zn-dependent protease
METAMAYVLADRMVRREMARRDFIRLMTVSAASLSAPGILGGCATDPVTGQTTLVGLSEEDEVAIDRRQSPHQLSSDYGAVQDQRLNGYLTQIGSSMAGRSHRPQMPYSFRAVNANYVNAYAFPGGSVATTRGILLELNNEAELAALLGHEVGHVNARHAAEQAGRGLVTSLLVAGAAIATAAAGYGDYAGLVQVGGMIGGSALLAKYSRDNEREADSLGLEYMTRAGYSPVGMVGLMDMLQRQSKEKPNMLEAMFASHPMSDERYATARTEAEGTYAAAQAFPTHQERYMDMTSPLRRLKPAIDEQQRGEGQMRRKDLRRAETHLSNALRLAPDDYTGNILMAKCLIAQKRHPQAGPYLDRAKSIYPGEGQAVHLSGINKLVLRKPDAAFQEFDQYERRLPGNPNTIFFKGIAQENMQNRAAAAREYQRYLEAVGQGDQAEYAATRLKAWGYLK